MSDGSAPTETSVVVAAWHRLTSRLKTDDSRVGRLSQQLSAVLSRSLEASGLATLGTALLRWVRASVLYRWLTTEPDPEIVVIDLRETSTLGPLIAVLDRLAGPLFRGCQTARAGSLADTTSAALRDHPVRTVSVVALGALLTNLAVSAASGTLSAPGLGVRLSGVALAALGTRIRISWAQCTESVTYRTLVAVFEPPKPPAANESEDD